MSYSGYEQHFCKNGHYYEADIFYFTSGYPEICPVCKQPSALVNSVDCTNGYNDGMIPPKFLEELLISPEVKEVCNLGHEHIVKYATYRIPTEDELDKIRVYGEP